MQGCVIYLSKSHSAGWLTEVYGVIFLRRAMMISLAVISRPLELAVAVEHALRIVSDPLFVLQPQVLDRLVRNYANGRLFTSWWHRLVVLTMPTRLLIVVLLTTPRCISILRLCGFFLFKNGWVSDLFMRPLVVKLFLVAMLLDLWYILLLLVRWRIIAFKSL